MSDQQTPFLFDDFFVPEDAPGEEIEVEIKGRMVPMRFSTQISVKDAEEAKMRCVRRKLDPKTGQVKIVGVDESRLTGEVLAKCIKRWPFTYRDGRPVPITPENCLRMCAEAAEKLVSVVKRGEEAQSEAMATFPAADAAEPGAAE